MMVAWVRLCCMVGGRDGVVAAERVAAENG